MPSLALDEVVVPSEPEEDKLRIETEATCIGKIGVEMEALTVAGAAPVVYDMLKAIDGGMVSGGLRLLEKRGDKSDFAEKNRRGFSGGGGVGP